MHLGVSSILATEPDQVLVLPHFEVAYLSVPYITLARRLRLEPTCEGKTTSISMLRALLARQRMLYVTGIFKARLLDTHYLYFIKL